MIKSFLTIFFIFIFSVFSFSQKKIIIKLKENKTGIDVKYTEKNKFYIRNSISEIEFKSFSGKADSFLKLNTENLIKTFNKGNPDLPVYSRLIEVPQDAKVKLTVVSYDKEIINLNEKNIHNKIMPAQPSLRKDKDPTDVPFYYNEKVYKTDAFYSQGKHAVYEEAGQMRDVRLGRIEIRPFEYNPVKNQLKILNNILVKIEFIGADLEKTEALKRKYASPFVSLPSTSVIYKLQNKSKELIQYAPVTFVIVADRSFESALQPFVQWKTMKGFKVIEAYTDESNVGNTVSSIKAYLKDLYENPPEGQSPPSFILVVGDIDKVPATQHTEVADNPYSDLDLAEYTGDYLPEVNYGRWSADDSITVEHIVYKTIRYEKLEMSDISYLKNTFLLAGNDEGNEDTYGGGAMWYGNEYYFNPEHNINNHLWLQDTVESWVGGNTAAHDSLIYQINNGVAFANYTAHCSSDGWSSPSFSQNDLNNYITNIDKYGIWVGNCCQSNMFNVNESFSELAIRKENAGVIGYIGGSQYTYWAEDYYWGVGVAGIKRTPSYEESTEGCFDGLFHDKTNEASNLSAWYETTYQFNKAGLLAVEASTSGRKAYYWVIYQVAGDPSIMPFVGTPQPMTVIPSPAELMIGMTSLNVSSAPYAYVALSQNGVLIAATMSDANGNANLSFKSDVLSVGNADIVITAQNRVPYIGTIPVSPADKPLIILNSYSTNIPPDYGKSIMLNVSLENIASSGSGYDADNINAVISTSDPYASITDNTEVYGTITAGDSLLINNAFAVTLANNIPDQHVINFNIAITADNGYSWNATLNLTANAPAISIGEMFITNDDNNDGRLDPGEIGSINFKITNIGHAAAVFRGILSETNDPNDYLILGKTIISHLSIATSDSKNFIFIGTSADIDTPSGSLVGLQLDVIIDSSEQYSAVSNQDLIIGYIPEYCSAGGGCDEYISNVNIDSINNSSNCSRYFDYTDLSTDVFTGNSYQLTVKVGNPYGADQLAAYVDWNYDGDFTDDGEEFIMTWNNPTAQTEIIVPEYAQAKSLRMRIRLTYDSAPTSCGTTIYGEVEDYTLNVLRKSATTVENLNITKIQIIPNPNNGLFTIKTDGLKTLNPIIKIYSVSGKLIFQNRINSNVFDIDLTHQAKGIYFVKILSGNQIFNSKLIIK